MFEKSDGISSLRDKHPSVIAFSSILYEHDFKTLYCNSQPDGSRQRRKHTFRPDIGLTITLD